MKARVIADVEFAVAVNSVRLVAEATTVKSHVLVERSIPVSKAVKHPGIVDFLSIEGLKIRSGRNTKKYPFPI